jgi:hypothetical protein
MGVDQPGATIYHFPVATQAPQATERASATEERGATPTPQPRGEPESKDSKREFLRAASRDLTEKEASSPAGIRWLAHDAERLDRECDGLREEVGDLRQKYDFMKDQFNDKRVEVETLRGGTRISKRNEILSNLALAGGGAGLGAAPSYFAVQGAQNMAYTVMAISAVLVVGAILFRAWK